MATEDKEQVLVALEGEMSNPKDLIELAKERAFKAPLVVAAWRTESSSRLAGGERAPPYCLRLSQFQWRAAQQQRRA